MQDYMLFHILDDYSVDLWKRQIDLILESNGMATFVVHPDYIVEERPRQVYTNLLDHLSMLRLQRRLWIVPPRDVNRWWRERNSMNLVGDECGWRIEGRGSERACLAYARRVGEKLTYSVEGCTPLKTTSLCESDRQTSRETDYQRREDCSYHCEADLL